MINRAPLLSLLVLVACGSERDRAGVDAGPRLDGATVDAAIVVDAGDLEDEQAHDAACMVAWVVCADAAQATCGAEEDACRARGGDAETLRQCGVAERQCLGRARAACDAERCGRCTPRCEPHECVDACRHVVEVAFFACQDPCERPEGDTSDRCGCAAALIAAREGCDGADPCGALVDALGE